jgi:hypothetical protein
MAIGLELEVSGVARAGAGAGASRCELDEVELEASLHILAQRLTNVANEANRNKPTKMNTIASPLSPPEAEEEEEVPSPAAIWLGVHLSYEVHSHVALTEEELDRPVESQPLFEQELLHVAESAPSAACQARPAAAISQHAMPNGSNTNTSRRLVPKCPFMPPLCPMAALMDGDIM